MLTILNELGFQRTQGYISTKLIKACTLLISLVYATSGAGDGNLFTKTWTCLHTSLVRELSDINVTPLKIPECPQNRSVARNPPSGRK